MHAKHFLGNKKNKILIIWKVQSHLQTVKRMGSKTGKTVCKFVLTWKKKMK